MATRRRKTEKEGAPAKAEKLTKVAARKRRIKVELTEEQLASFSKVYETLNPSEAAELVFTVKKRPASKLKIAGYSYSGSTCCA